MFAVLRFDTHKFELTALKSGYIKDFFLSQMFIQKNGEIILLGAQHKEQTGQKTKGGDGIGFSKEIRPVRYVVNFEEKKIAYAWIGNIPDDKKIKFDQIYLSDDCSKAMYRCSEKSGEENYYYRLVNLNSEVLSMDPEVSIPMDQNCENINNKTRFANSGVFFMLTQHWPKNTLLNGLDINTGWLRLSLINGSKNSLGMPIRFSEISGLKDDLRLMKEYKAARQNGVGLMDTMPQISLKDIRMNLEYLQEHEEGIIAVLSTKVGKGTYNNQGTPIEDFIRDGYQLLSYHVLCLSGTGKIKWQKSFQRWNRTVDPGFSGENEFSLIISGNDAYFMYPFQQNIRINKMDVLNGILSPGMVRFL